MVKKDLTNKPCFSMGYLNKREREILRERLGTIKNSSVPHRYVTFLLCANYQSIQEKAVSKIDNLIRAITMRDFS